MSEMYGQPPEGTRPWWKVKYSGTRSVKTKTHTAATVVSCTESVTGAGAAGAACCSHTLHVGRCALSQK